jgi:hypothetical protein
MAVRTIAIIKKKIPAVGDPSLCRILDGYWEGACGTGKQQIPGQCPREFADAKRQEITLREKGHWEGSCGTGIGGKK